VSEVPPAVAARDLWPALEEGLILPLDPGYRFFAAELPEGQEAPALTARQTFRLQALTT